MRRLMLSTLALVALASPAAAQERVCREPNQAVESFRRQLNQTYRHRPSEHVCISPYPAPPEGINEWRRRNCPAPPLTPEQRTNSEGPKIFDRAFKEHCKSGDAINLTANLRTLALTHCDLSRPSHQVGNTVICFAQVPPRE